MIEIQIVKAAMLIMFIVGMIIGVVATLWFTRAIKRGMYNAG